ncbi:MAG: hypothetical protein ACOH10_13745 [Rhodoglobus sp.]
MNKRDDLLDTALGAVRGALEGGSLLPQVLASLDPLDLRLLVGKLALIAGWAIDADDFEDLAVKVETMQLVRTSR